MCLYMLHHYACGHTKLIPHPCDETTTPLVLELCPSHKLLPHFRSDKCSSNGVYCRETSYGKWMDHMIDQLEELELEEYLSTSEFPYITFKDWAPARSYVRLMRCGKVPLQALPSHSEAQAAIITKARRLVFGILATSQSSHNMVSAAQRVQAAFNAPMHNNNQSRSLQGNQHFSGGGYTTKASDPSTADHKQPESAPNKVLGPKQNLAKTAFAQACADIARNSPVSRTASAPRQRPKKHPAAQHRTMSLEKPRSARACAQKTINYADPPTSDSSREEPSSATSLNAITGALTLTSEQRKSAIAVSDAEGNPAQGLKRTRDGNNGLLSDKISEDTLAPTTKRGRIAEDSPLLRFSTSSGVGMTPQALGLAFSNAPHDLQFQPSSSTQAMDNLWNEPSAGQSVAFTENHSMPGVIPSFYEVAAQNELGGMLKHEDFGTFNQSFGSTASTWVATEYDPPIPALPNSFDLNMITTDHDIAQGFLGTVGAMQPPTMAFLGIEPAATMLDNSVSMSRLPDYTGPACPGVDAPLQNLMSHHQWQQRLHLYMPQDTTAMTLPSWIQADANLSMMLGNQSSIQDQLETQIPPGQCDDQSPTTDSSNDPSL